MTAKERPLRRSVLKEEYYLLTGNTLAARILGQMIYWSSRTKTFDLFLAEEQAAGKGLDVELRNGWVYKTANELAWELMEDVSAPTIRRRMNDLKNAGYIDDRTNPRTKWDHTLQYRVNIAKIKSDLAAMGLELPEEDFRTVPVGIENSDSSMLHCEGSEVNREGSAVHGEGTITETTTETTNREEEIPPAAPTQTTAPNPEPSQPTLDPLMQTALNRFNGKRTNREKIRMDNVRDRLARLDIAPEQFRHLVNAHLSAKGTKVLADIDGDSADRELHTAQDFILALCQIGQRFKQTEWVTKLWSEWAEKDGRNNPSEQQLLQFASKMVSQPAPTVPQLSFKQWKLRTYNTDIESLIGIPKVELQAMYQAQYAH